MLKGVFGITDYFYPCATLPEGSEFSDIHRQEPLYIVIAGQQLLCHQNSQQFLFELAALSSAELSLDRTFPQYLLGIYKNRPCYVLDFDCQPIVAKGYEWSGVRSFLGHVDDLHFNLAGRASQIINWYKEHRFCGCCGQPTEVSDVDHARFCRHCDRQFYPRISPCVIVIVTKGDYCLLARNSAWEKRFYSALAGFIEPGETVELSLHREVKEEVGIEVENLQYFSSQPWPFPGQLMLGFHAEYKSGEIQVDNREIVEANWWHYEDLPPCPAPQTLSGCLIDHFVSQRKQRR